MALCARLTSAVCLFVIAGSGDVKPVSACGGLGQRMHQPDDRRHSPGAARHTPACRGLAHNAPTDGRCGGRDT